MSYLQQTYSETVNREKEDNETLKTKVFVLEQLIIKKENVVANLKRKAELQKDSDYSDYEREIYIIEPTKAVAQINDELLMYKQIYDSLITHIKEARESLLKSEVVITELQKENSKLRLQYKYHIITANREKETLINAIQHERLSSNTRHLTDNGSKSMISQGNSKICKTQVMPDELFLYKKLRLTNIDNTKFENEEFMEILKTSNLNQNEFEKLSKIKTCSKLTEIIEMLYSLLKDKNMSLNLLKEENERLTSKNFQLNKDNMILLQQNVEFKKQLVSDKTQKSKNKSNCQDSLINNTSQITVNQNISNAISTYHKLIKLEEKKTPDILTDSFARENSSEHDSIVYMKNIKEYSNDVIGDTTSASKDKRTFENIAKANDHKMTRNQNIMTMESITSSEFREGCKDINSFISTIRGDNCNESKGVNLNEKENDLDIVNIKATNI